MSLRRILPLLSVFAAFAAWTAWLHPDVIRHPDTAVLGGDSVSGYFVWDLWRLAKAWGEGTPLFHTALVFHPGGAALFPQTPLLEAASVPLQRVLSPYATLNALLLITYPLTGLTTFILLRRITADAPAAFLGAFLHAFSAYMLNQHRHGHLNDTVLFWNPLLVFTVLVFWRRPTAATWAGVLLSAAGVCLSGPYIAFYFGGFLAVGTALFDLVRQKGAWLRGLAGRMTPGRAAAAVMLPAAVMAAYWPLLRGAGGWVGGAERLSMYALSHLHPVTWHRAAWWRELFFPGNIRTEETIGTLGLLPLALLAVVAVRRLWRTVPGLGYWLWIAAFAAVMSWGPKLRLTPSLETGIPMPYALVQSLPVLGTFRSVSRVWMLGALACAVWTALLLARLTAGWSARRRWALAAAACLLWTWEADLLQMRGWRFFVRRDMTVHAAMREDPLPGALLELPNGPDARQDLPSVGLLYLLHQPLHGRPLVLAKTARHRPADLAFILRTPAFRELAQPWTLAAVEKDPARAAWLAANAKDIFSRNGVRYVLWHRKLRAFIGVEEEALVQPYLERWFGPPVAKDGEDHLLYRVEGDSEGRK